MKKTNKFAIIFSIIAISANFITQANPNFEIFNKANTPIGVIVRDADNRNPNVEKFIVRPGKGNQERLTINPNQRLLINIYNNVNDISQIKSYPDAYAFIKAPGKTKYLTWDPTKKPALYPQTGPLMGLAGKYQHHISKIIPQVGPGKTESGYPLDNNVTSSEIDAHMFN